jgi:uncharacterized SAM-binding protein YcdF (DUF218 family)
MEALGFLDFLRPVLKAALLPPGSILLLLLAGLMLGKRCCGRLLAWLALLALYLLSTTAATHWLAQHLETHPAKSAEELQAAGAQAILVLSAGYTRNNPELDGLARPAADSLERLGYALHLHQQTRLPIIISGGKLNPEDEPLAQVLARWLHESAGIEPVALETQSSTTWENLQYSAPLLQELGIARVALVTHAYHMPRALQSAEAHGVSAIPAPFGYLGSKPAKPTDYRDLNMWTPLARQLRRNYLMLHELLGSTWYRFKG